MIVAAAKRHDPRGRAFERAGILELLRDDQRVGVGETEPLEEMHVFGVVDSVVEQRAGQQACGIDDKRLALPPDDRVI